jgi:hypothetical protein
MRMQELQERLAEVLDTECGACCMDDDADRHFTARRLALFVKELINDGNTVVLDGDYAGEE